MQPWVALLIALTMSLVAAYVHAIGSPRPPEGKRLLARVLGGGCLGLAIVMVLWLNLGHDLDHVMVLLGLSFCIVLAGLEAKDLRPLLLKLIQDWIKRRVEYDDNGRKTDEPKSGDDSLPG